MGAGASQQDYDIVIAGGGMIGTSLGLALAPLKLRIAVVEAVAREADEQPSFDDRSTALSRSTQRLYEAIGLWPRIVAASTPIKSIHISDRGRFGFAHIDAEEQAVEALGYVVINRVLGRVLQEALCDVEQLDFICPARIAGVKAGAEATTLALDDGRTLGCSLLVAADGANSTVRNMLGIGASRVDYEQCAVIGNLLPEKPPRNRAFERFTETGPIALLPIADQRAAFVWILPANEVDAVMALSDDAFTARLQSIFGYRLGRFSRVGGRAAYPLALTRANALTVRRGVVIGNAAHGLHPVAAQGFNLGMRDVAALCDCIADHLAGQRRSGREDFDCGAEDVLERYADWRRDDQRKVVRFTDGIVRLFGDGRLPVRRLRNLGMLGFDLLPGVRRFFARHTMGLAGRLPRLSRGIPLE